MTIPPHGVGIGAFSVNTPDDGGEPSSHSGAHVVDGGVSCLIPLSSAVDVCVDGGVPPTLPTVAHDTGAMGDACGQVLRNEVLRAAKTVVGGGGGCGVCDGQIVGGEQWCDVAECVVALLTGASAHASRRSGLADGDLVEAAQPPHGGGEVGGAVEGGGGGTVGAISGEGRAQQTAERLDWLRSSAAVRALWDGERKATHAGGVVRLMHRKANRSVGGLRQAPRRTTVSRGGCNRSAGVSAPGSGAVEGRWSSDFGGGDGSALDNTVPATAFGAFVGEGSGVGGWCK